MKNEPQESQEQTMPRRGQETIMDPWKHRSNKMKCKTCMWFVIKEGAVENLGRCRRHAPTMQGYPVVFSSDWCGDFKLDENKVKK